MRVKILIIVLSFFSICNGQQDERISQLIFIQILNDNREEAIFYYQNNRVALSEMGIREGLVESYQLLETPYSEEEPYHLIEIITFINKEKYNNRHGKAFKKFKKEKKADILMNDKKPSEFRKVLFKKEVVKHLH